MADDKDIKTTKKKLRQAAHHHASDAVLVAAFVARQAARDLPKHLRSLANKKAFADSQVVYRQVYDAFITKHSPKTIDPDLVATLIQAKAFDDAYRRKQANKIAAAALSKAKAAV